MKNHCIRQGSEVPAWPPVKPFLRPSLAALIGTFFPRNFRGEGAARQSGRYPSTFLGQNFLWVGKPSEGS